MSRMNLLPWREERRKLRNRETGALLGAIAVAAVLAVIGIITVYNTQISRQQERNQTLQDEVTKVEGKIKEIADLEKQRSKLLQKKATIEELQASRSMMVHLFDTLVRTLPDGITLSSIKQNGDVMELNGLAESYARISTYMRNFETSEWLTAPDLVKAEATGVDKRSRYVFTLKVNIKKPKSEGDTGSAPATTPGAPS